MGTTTSSSGGSRMPCSGMLEHVDAAGGYARSMPALSAAVRTAVTAPTTRTVTPPMGTKTPSAGTTPAVGTMGTHHRRVTNCRHLLLPLSMWPTTRGRHMNGRWSTDAPSLVGLSAATLDTSPFSPPRRSALPYRLCVQSELHILQSL
jgi:hypothetical protein